MRKKGITPSRIILLGTRHRYQTPDESVSQQDIALFKNLIRTLCVGEAISVIGEEMNCESLSTKRLDASTVKEVASELGKIHKYCDPTTEERRNLGIDVEGAKALRAELYGNVLHEMMMDSVEHTEDEVDQEVSNRYLSSKMGQEENSLRESFWMGMIAKFDSSIILFVLGANHIDTFSTLLRSRNYEVMIAAANWEPR